MCLIMTILTDSEAYIITDNFGTVFTPGFMPVNAKDASELHSHIEFVFNYGCKVIKLNSNAGLAWGTSTAHKHRYIEEQVELVNYADDPETLASIPLLRGFLASYNSGGLEVWSIKEGEYYRIGATPGKWHFNYQAVEFYYAVINSLIGTLMPNAFRGKIGIEDAVKALFRGINKECPIIGPVPYMAKVDKEGFKWL